MAVFMISGPDRVGKDTQARNLKRHLEERGNLVHMLHYSAIKGDDIENRSKELYRQMFGMIRFSEQNKFSLILNRAHEGETIYGKLYRGYDAEWVYDLEKEYQRYLTNMVLFTFVDSAENLIAREDGLSFTTDIAKKTQEVELFTKFNERSHIPFKQLIDIRNADEKKVWQYMLEYLTYIKSTNAKV